MFGFQGGKKLTYVALSVVLNLKGPPKIIFMYMGTHLKRFGTGPPEDLLTVWHEVMHYEFVYLLFLNC